MRDLADADRVRLFMRELGRSCEKPARIYFTGGASAVLLGWRTATIDLDIKIVAGEESVLRAIPRLKEEASLFSILDPEEFKTALDKALSE